MVNLVYLGHLYNRKQGLDKFALNVSQVVEVESALVASRIFFSTNGYLSNTVLKL